MLELEQLRPPCRGESIEALSSWSADRENSKGSGRFDRRDIGLAGQVELGENDTMRLGGKVRRIGRDFGAELIVFSLPIHGVDGNQKSQQPRALDVPEELKSQSLPFVRALDDAGNVRDDEGPAVAEL